MANFDLTLDATRGVASASMFAPQGERFLVELEGSTISDGSGEQRYCLNLRSGADVHVDGTVQPNGTISDTSMIVDGEGRLRKVMTVRPWVTRALPQATVPKP